MSVTNPTFLVWTKRIHSIHPFPKNESKNQKQNRFVQQPTWDLGATLPTSRQLCLNETWSHDLQWASPKLGVVGISTLWHFRLPLPIQMFIKVASSPRLSGIGMPSPILWYHPLKMQRIVLLSSLLWWELGTNSLITGPGEWLSFRRFTSKLSWSWSW